MPTDPQNQQPQIGQPHEVGWFWRLLGLYSRQSHSAGYDLDIRDDMKSSEMAQEWWKRQFKIAGTRLERYRIFEEMDGAGIVSSMLDLYAEEACQADYDRDRVIWIESNNEAMRKAGEECLRNVMAEDRSPAIVRRLCKYGDAFQRVIYQGGKGVLAWQYAPTDKVHRVEDRYSRIVGFRQDGLQFRAKSRTVSWPWDYVHFRMLGKDEDSGYGTSMLDSMFSPWRALTLAQDSILMYRMRRAPDRNLIMVDVGNMEEAEAMDYAEQFKKRFRKTEYIDPASPQYRKQYNPLTPMEDIFLPVRGAENGTRVESLSGSGNMDNIFDLNFFRDMFFGAAKIPKAYMGFEGEINAKATLLQQDVRFARTIKKIKKSHMYGMRQLLDMHYTLLDNGRGNYDFTREGNQYLVKMSPCSYLDEYDRLELVQLRAQILEAMAAFGTTLRIDPQVWTTYILVNYAKLPEQVVLRLMTKSGAQQPSPQDIAAIEAFSGKRFTPGSKAAMLNLTEGSGSAGFYGVSDVEKRYIAEAIHASPMLRKVIGDITEVHIDDLMIQQTDASYLPPSVLGEDFCDDTHDTVEIKALNEEVRDLRKKMLTEGK